MSSEREQDNSGTFENPTGSQGRRQSAEGNDEEAGVGSYSTPDESGFSEQAAAPEAANALRGIDEGLLEIKRAIEQQLLQDVSAGAAVHAADALGGSSNIVGIGIGAAGLIGGRGSHAQSALATTAGAEPGAPALNVYVVEPMSAEQVKSVVVESMSIEAAGETDVAVNVIVTGYIDAQPHRFRLRPAPAGVSVGHYKITAGTIGCLAIGNSAPRNARLMVLSNTHVLANVNGGVFGDCICQPGPYDGGKCPADQIAILERFVPINFAGGVNYVDCATGWAWPDRVRRELVYLSGGVPTYFRISSAPVAPYVGMPVGKSGRTTQLTHGQVTDVSATIRVNYGAGRVALFADQIAVRAASGDFSAGGDSGSSIWTWDARRSPVGLLFAGGGGTTFGNKMARVLTALDIRLYT